MKLINSKTIIWVAYSTLGILVTSSLFFIPSKGNIFPYTPLLIGCAVLVFSVVRKQKAPIIAYAVGAFIPYFLFLVFLFLNPIFDDYSKRIEFDSTAWKNSNTISDPEFLRLRMVDSFLSKNQLIGMHKTEIEELIGPPDDTEYKKNWDMVYWLGPERSFISIDSEWLVFNYNRDNIITEYKIVTD